jgi:hypothetical protein
MIILDSTLKSLEVKLAGAITTNQLPWSVSYVDVDQTSFAATAASEADGATNSGTAVTMVAAPSAGKSRQVKFISVHNADTVAATVTIQINNNGTLRIVFKATLAVGDQIQFVG